MKKSLLYICSFTLLIFGLQSCKKDSFENRPKDVILNGGSVSSWEIVSIEDQSGLDMIDSLIPDCQKDDFYALYSDQKFEKMANNIKCKNDSDLVSDQGLWDVSTDDAFFYLLSGNEYTKQEFRIEFVSSTDMYLKLQPDSIGYKYHFRAK